MRVWPGGKDFRLFKAVYLGWLLNKYFVKVPYMVPIKIPGSLNLCCLSFWNNTPTVAIDLTITLVPWPIRHYYIFSKMLKISKFISSKSQCIAKDNSEYLRIFHMLK
jgi:hypothetical protein